MTRILSLQPNHHSHSLEPTNKFSVVAISNYVTHIPPVHPSQLFWSAFIYAKGKHESQSEERNREVGVTQTISVMHSLATSAKGIQVSKEMIQAPVFLSAETQTPLLKTKKKGLILLITLCGWFCIYINLKCQTYLNPGHPWLTLKLPGFCTVSTWLQSMFNT